MTKTLVLIVEDNLVNLRMTKMVLIKRGFEVLTAKSAEEALNLLEKNIPDVILMDIQLPGIDGLKLTSLLKKDPLMQHIVILALTAYASAQDQERVLAAGCDGFISKPYEVLNLSHVINKYLEKKHNDKA